jgi:alpha-beta hydrolase superfamily lysophospholipase
MSEAVVSPGISARCELGAFEGAGRRHLRYGIVRASPERQVLLYLHGIESHGGWFLPAAEALAQRGCTTYLLDRRGSGLNLEPEPGDAASVAVLLEDLRRFRAHVGLKALVLVGLSWGGKLALAAALDQPEGVRAVVLVTPGLVARVGFPWPKRLGIALSLALGGRMRFHVPIEPEMFTRTPRYLEYIANDPLRLKSVTARFLLASHALDRTLRARLHTLKVPVLLFLAGQDRIIDNERTLELLGRLPDGCLRTHTYAGAMHSIQFEETDALVRDVTRFVEEVTC